MPEDQPQTPFYALQSGEDLAHIQRLVGRHPDTLCE